MNGSDNRVVKPKRVVFLHGLGETPSVWQPVIDLLPGIEAYAPDLFACAGNTPWSLEETTDYIAGALPGPVTVVGLSLGAMVSIALAARYPQLVDSLFLSAPQVRTPRALMSLQHIVIGLLPQRLVCPTGLTKKALLQVLDAVSHTDLAPCLPRITAQTTIVCGKRDLFNLPASRFIASALPDAQMRIVPQAGHTWHATNPQQFAEHVLRLLNAAG